MSSSSAASPYFQNSQFYQHNPQYNPQFYTPLVNVPTMNRLPSHGELAASVDLLIAHITKITTRLDRIESRVNDWVNLELAERMVNAEKRMDTLAMQQNENATKIASTNIELDYVFDSIKYANERIIDNENAVDRITDIISKHESKLRHAKQRSRDNSKKCAEIGVLRRRISKVEDFNTEFAESFETPSQLRGIVAEISNHVEECDRTLSYMVKYDYERKSTYDVLNHSNGCDDYNNDTEGDRLDALNNVQEFFASYEGEGECDNVDKTENPLQWSSLALDEEIGAAAGEDDDFEKI
jgi:chromosome segregation ATPase